MNYFLVKMITMIQLNKLKIKETCGTRFHGILIFEGQKIWFVCIYFEMAHDHEASILDRERKRYGF